MNKELSSQKTLFLVIAQMHVHGKTHYLELVSDRFWLKINYVSVEKTFIHAFNGNIQAHFTANYTRLYN